MDFGRGTDTHQCLAVTSGQSMVASANVSSQRVFNVLWHHGRLSGKEFFEKAAWPVIG